MVFAKLKPGIKEAKYVLGEILYPHKKHYIMFSDTLYDRLKQRDYIEVLTEQEYKNIFNKPFNDNTAKSKANDNNVVSDKKDVDEFVNLHWKTIEKEANNNDDIKFLEDALVKAKKLKKNKVCEILENRINELKKQG